MKKLMVPGSTFFLALILSGCGSDVREALISKTIEDLNKAAGSLSTIKENVEKWEKEKKDADKAKYLKNAVEGTKSLKEIARVFQQIKLESEKLETATKEQREEYIQKYRDRLGTAIERLNKEQTALNQAIARGESLGTQSKTALAELKQKLQQTQGEFEVLTKQR